jgi:hypothetical protein
MLIRNSADEHPGDVILVHDCRSCPENSYVLYVRRGGKAVRGLPTRKLIASPAGCDHDWHIVSDPFCSQVDGARSVVHAAYKCSRCLCTGIYCFGGDVRVLGPMEHVE